MSRSHAVITAVAGIAVAAFYFASANPDFRFQEGASAIKILHARSLLSGAGYTDIGRIGAPPEIVRPPGLPVLIAAVFALFGENLLAAKLLVNLFAIPGFIALWLLMKKLTGNPLLATAITACGWLTPHFFFLGRYLESEIPFAACLYSALYLIEKAREEKYKRVAPLLGFSIIMSAAVMLRTAALVLPAGAIAAIILDREATAAKRLRFAAVIAIAWIAVGGGWMLRNQVVKPPGELTYLNKLMAGEPVGSLYWLLEDQRVPLIPPPKPGTLATILGRAPGNFAYFANQAAENLLPIKEPDRAALFIIIGPPLLLILIGLGRDLIKKRGAVEFTLLFYLIMVLVWPYQDNRFLLPAAPLLIYYLTEGIRVFWKSEKAPSILAAVIAVLALSFLVRDARLLITDKAIHRPPVLELSPHFLVTAPNPGAAHSAVALDWIRKNSSPSDRVLYHSYSPCALLANRQCSGIPLLKPEGLMKFIDDNGITFLVVDDEAEMSGNAMASFTPKLLVPLIESYPGRFQNVFRVPGSKAQVYRVTR